MLELFVVGTFWFWALIAASIVLLFVCTEYEAGGWATVTVLGTLAALNFLCGVPILSFLWEHPIVILLGVGAYFLLGTLWAVAKWWFYVSDQLYKYREAKKKFIADNGLEITVYDPIPTEELRSKWESEMWRHDERFELHPKVSRHKMSIYIWIMYFPFSMIWTLINDPVRKICRRIYHMIADTLQSISDSIWAGTKDDFNDKKKKPNVTVKE